MQHFYTSKSLVQQKQGTRFSKESTYTKFLLSFLLLAFFFGMSMKAEAQIVVTASTGGTNLPVDRASNSTNPAGGTWTPITDIFITETIKSDFTNVSLGTPATTITNTIYIDAPSNWLFNTSGVTAQAVNGGGSNGTDISIASGSMTSTRITLTVTFDNNGNNNSQNKVDRIIISGLQVKAVSGAIVPGLGNITSSIPNAGSLGTLSQASGGTVTQIAFSIQPTTSTYGSAIVGFPTIQTRDQFGNPSTVGLGATLNVVVSVTNGTTTASTTTLNIGTSGGNGTVTYSNLFPSSIGTKTISATATGTVSGLVSTFTVSSASFIVNPKALTITGLSGVDKVYDGLTPCVLSGTASLVGVINNDAVTLSGVGTGSFSNSNVGPNKAVAVTGYTITGGGSNNYTLTQPTLSANITQRPLTVSGITATSKVYDGNNTCVLSYTNATLQNTISSDDVSLSTSGVTATFNNQNVGTGKTVTRAGSLLALAGTAANNYTLTQPALTYTANITPKTLRIINVTAKNRDYDGTTKCDLEGVADLEGLVSTDAGKITLGGTPLAVFLSKNAGNSSIATVSGYTLSGNATDIGNYTLEAFSPKANIAQLPLTVSVLSENKTDSKGDPIVSLFTTNVLTGDTVNLAYASAKYVTDATTGYKSIDVTGITISGKDASNYNLQTTQAMGINPLPVTLVSFTGKYSKNAGVTLNWSTATEKDNDYFQVERSVDGKTFTSVGKVKGNGNSSLLLKYQFVDGQALNGTVYYRLRQVDFDGKFEYSKVIAVNGQGGTLAAGSLKAYPNPTFTGKVTLEVGRGQGGTTNISVLNGAGQVLSSEEVMLVEGQRYEVDLTQQKAGMYLLQVENGTGRSINRIVKQ